MGNYRQHLGFASTCGVSYAVAMYFLTGVHWLYGSVGFMLSTLGGLLPDVDSDSGVEMKTFTGILGVLAAIAVWGALDALKGNLPFEMHLWAMVLAYMAVRRGLRLIVGKITVHRGMSHSIPMCCIWGAVTYLYYPSQYHAVRFTMAAAVMIGFFSHLVLDEVCSVDLKGARLNKAFGTALKFWSGSIWSTLLVYTLLGYLSWKVIQIWPEGDTFFAWNVPDPNLSGTIARAHDAIDTIRK